MSYISNCDGDEFYSVYRCPICKQMGLVGRHKTIIHQGADKPGKKVQLFYHRSCAPTIPDVIARGTLLCSVCEAKEGVTYGWIEDERSKYVVVVSLCEAHTLMRVKEAQS